MSVCLDDLNSLPERYRKQVQQQMQAQQIDRTARVMARFVTEEKGKAEAAEHLRWQLRMKCGCWRTVSILSFRRKGLQAFYGRTAAGRLKQQR